MKKLGLILLLALPLGLFSYNTDLYFTTGLSDATMKTNINNNIRKRPLDGNLVANQFDDIVDNKLNLDKGLFTSNVTFVLSSGKSFGKYTNGQTASWSGKSATEALLDAAIEYINPAYSAFSITGQPTTDEVGVTLSGSKTFTWTIAANSGVK